MVKPLKEGILNVPHRSEKANIYGAVSLKKSFQYIQIVSHFFSFLSQIESVASFRDDTENSLGEVGK